MIILKEFNQDITYIIRLKNYNNGSEYCLVDANNQDNIYAVFEEEPINE